MRILVTPRSITARSLDEVRELDPLRAQGWEIVAGPAGRTPSARELEELLPGVDGWLCGVEIVSAESLAHADRLTVIARNGVGADAIDHDAAASRGIRIALARGSNANGVAELAVAHMLGGLRDLPASHIALHAGEWERRLGRELADSTVGIVGYGAIGRIVSRIVRAFGARVVAFDPFTDVTLDGVEAAGISDLFASSHVVSLHSPPSATGRPIVDALLLESMPDGAVVVNTARSALVDGEAMLSALESGRVSTYAVDAFDQEPPVLDALLRHPRTVMSPHLGGFTGGSTRRATLAAVENIVALLTD
jgi:D-3-phosphoglycerate dehydrogenase / 2-oxoglutarate reductase